MASSQFDRAAATWDEQPARIAMIQRIAEAIRARVPVRASMTAVDYGCGTGLLTLALQPAVRRIVGVDSSEGMLARLREKLAAADADNVEIRQLDLETQPAPDDIAPDLIVSAMTLHHIADVAKLLGAFHQWLRPDGYLALADLDREDGSFHGDRIAAHHSGIDRDWLTAQLREIGFGELQATTAHTIERPDGAGGVRRYPVFVVTGRKGA